VFFLTVAHPSTYYFWDSNPEIKKVHSAVACTIVHALLTFNYVYASGTAKNKREQGRLLGKSPCMGPMRRPILPAKEPDMHPSQAPHQGLLMV
jgi:hypothetical protein